MARPPPCSSSRRHRKTHRLDFSGHRESGRLCTYCALRAAVQFMHLCRLGIRGLRKGTRQKRLETGSLQLDERQRMQPACMTAHRSHNHGDSPVPTSFASSFQESSPRDHRTGPPAAMRCVAVCLNPPAILTACLTLSSFSLPEQIWTFHLLPPPFRN